MAKVRDFEVIEPMRFRHFEIKNRIQIPDYPAENFGISILDSSKPIPNSPSIGISIPMKSIDEEHYKLDSLGELQKHRFKIGRRVFTNHCIRSMLASLVMIKSYPSADEHPMTIGVGGGAILSLMAKLEFNVCGVEINVEVLDVARYYFGLNDGKLLTLIAGDGIKFMEELCDHGDDSEEVMKLSNEFRQRHLIDAEIPNKLFDAIIIDTVSSYEFEPIAPALSFQKKSILKLAKKLILEGRVLIVNVIVPSDKAFLENLIYTLKSVYSEVYIVAGKNENSMVLTAIKSTSANEGVNTKPNDNLKKRLTKVLPADYLKIESFVKV